MPSLRAATAYAATQNLRRALEDIWRRGAWARALLLRQYHLAKIGKHLAELHRFSLRMRRLKAAADAGIQLDWQEPPDGSGELVKAIRNWQQLMCNPGSDADAQGLTQARSERSNAWRRATCTHSSRPESAASAG